MSPPVVTACQLLALPIHCCPAGVCLVFPAASRAAPVFPHLPVGSGALPRPLGGSRSWVLSEGSAGGWSSALGPQQPFQGCRCSSMHTGKCHPHQITCAEMLLSSVSSFLRAPGVLLLKCWSGCRFWLSRLLLVHSMAHTVEQNLAFCPCTSFHFHVSKNLLSDIHVAT